MLSCTSSLTAPSICVLTSPALMLSCTSSLAICAVTSSCLIVSHLAILQLSATSMNCLNTAPNSVASAGRASSKNSANSELLIIPSLFTSIWLSSLVFLCSVHRPCFCPIALRASPRCINLLLSTNPERSRSKAPNTCIRWLIRSFLTDW